MRPRQLPFAKKICEKMQNEEKKERRDSYDSNGNLAQAIPTWSWHH